jgi:hypothetical protein
VCPTPPPPPAGRGRAVRLAACRRTLPQPLATSGPPPTQDVCERLAAHAAAVAAWLRAGERQRAAAAAAEATEEKEAEEAEGEEAPGPGAGHDNSSGGGGSGGGLGAQPCQAPEGGGSAAEAAAAEAREAAVATALALLRALKVGGGAQRCQGSVAEAFASAACSLAYSASFPGAEQSFHSSPCPTLPRARSGARTRRRGSRRCGGRGPRRRSRRWRCLPR